MIEIASLIISLFALFMSGLALYYHYLVGPDIKLVFSYEDRNIVFNYLRGGMAKFEGVFINKGNRAGYIHNTNFIRAGLVKDVKNKTELIQMIDEGSGFAKEAENKKMFGVPGFVITIEPQAPLVPTLEVEKIKTPRLLREGDAFPFEIYLHKEETSNLEKSKEISQWFEEHSGFTIKVRIYYTSTTKKGLKTKYETLNVKI